jgi:hypothetical protein
MLAIGINPNLKVGSLPIPGLSHRSSVIRPTVTEKFRVSGRAEGIAFKLRLASSIGASFGTFADDGDSDA